MELTYKYIVICLVDSVERLPIVLDGYELPGIAGSLLLVWYCLCGTQGRQTRQNSGGVADLTKGGYKNVLIFTR